MGLFAWIILGLVAGWLASLIMNTNSQQNMLGDLFLGVLGALFGGFLFNLFGGDTLTGLNIYSLLVATLGSIALLGIKNTVA